MIQTTVEVGGMACSMCEAHINDAVRNACLLYTSDAADEL